MSLYRYSNNPTGAAVTTLAGGGIDAAVTTLTLAADVASLPSVPSFDILIDSELIHVGARSGVTLSSLTRGYGGTTAAVHAAGASIYNPLTVDGLLANPGPTTTLGDTWYLDATLRPIRRAIGAEGTVYTVVGGVPAWAAAASGGTTLTDSASLAAALSDETGTGLAVFGTNPTLLGATISGLILQPDTNFSGGKAHILRPMLGNYYLTYGDWSWRMTSAPNIGDAGRVDYSVTMGWNLGQAVAGINSISQTFEHYYNDGSAAKQSEFHFDVLTAAGVNYRPISFNHNFLGSDLVNILINADSFTFHNKTQTTSYVSLSSTGITLHNGAFLTTSGANNTFFIYQGGRGLIKYNGTAIQLGADSGEFIHLGSGTGTVTIGAAWVVDKNSGNEQCTRISVGTSSIIARASVQGGVAFGDVTANAKYTIDRSGSTGFCTLTGSQSGFTGFQFVSVGGSVNDFNILFDQSMRVTGDVKARRLLSVNLDTDLSNYERLFIGFTSNILHIGNIKGGSGTARVMQLDYGGTTTAAISIPITSGSLILGGGLTFPAAGDLVLDATTGTKIGTATSQKLGFYNATPIIQGASVADASGGAVIDAEARTALNALISRIEATGLIATV